VARGRFPAFDEHEVALLISAVERSLKHLREANEQLGGNDPEFVEYGKRYTVILEKLQAVLKKLERGLAASRLLQRRRGVYYPRTRSESGNSLRLSPRAKFCFWNRVNDAPDTIGVP
jgi:hypothetical protein